MTSEANNGGAQPEDAASITAAARVAERIAIGFHGDADDHPTGESNAVDGFESIGQAGVGVLG